MGETATGHGAVKVTGQDIPGHAEEKEVQYRKEQPSSAEPEPADVEPSSLHPDSEPVYSTQSIFGKPDHQEVKRVFVGMIDANADFDIGTVSFTWNRASDVTIRVTKLETDSDKQ